MDKQFHMSNRQKLYAFLPDNSLLVSFSGHAPRQSADAYYPLFANRNFVYLTGISSEGLVLMAKKTDGKVNETIYILPPDAMKERWTGRRPTKDEVIARSGIQTVRYVDSFQQDFHNAANSGNFTALWLDLYKHTADEADDTAHRFAASARHCYPFLKIENFLPQMKRQRTFKQPCEIEAMKEAMKVTRKGILAMMKASRPGMFEYQYKAEYDHALLLNGVLTPAFPSIISAGKNNFCIHSYSYTGQAHDGDMILNDVGACWDNEVNDVSRGWPCNGKFSKDQAALYNCAYQTSEYMFRTVKPGMPMRSVDETAHRFCCEELKKIGLLKSYDEIGKYMWHGGAHHIGYDVHDVVDMEHEVAPGNVFCIDIGIYAEEMGIGFRLEDNCYVTENGCVNLSASIPRSIEEIEATMRG